MPCYDGRDKERRSYACYDGRDKERRSYDCSLKHCNGSCERNGPTELEKKYTGALCAIFNELERRGILEQVVAEASRNGLIDIMSIYGEHKKDDISRLAKDIHSRYSKDEQVIIKTLLEL